MVCYPANLTHMGPHRKEEQLLCIDRTSRPTNDPLCTVMCLAQALPKGEAPAGRSAAAAFGGGGFSTTRLFVGRLPFQVTVGPGPPFQQPIYDRRTAVRTV